MRRSTAGQNCATQRHAEESEPAPRVRERSPVRALRLPVPASHYAVWEVFAQLRRRRAHLPPGIIGGKETYCRGTRDLGVGHIVLFCLFLHV